MNLRKIKLSVIMVNYNTKNLSIKSLNQVQVFLGNSSFEIIFVDNNSQDNSVAEIQSNFPQVKIIANTKNSGFSKAVNQGIAIAEGEYVLLINPDVALQTDTVEKLLNFVESCPQAAVVSPALLYPDNGRQDFCSHFPTLTRQFFHLTGMRILFPLWLKRCFAVCPEEKTQVFETDWVIGACVMLREKALEDISRDLTSGSVVRGTDRVYLDEDFFMYGEDLDLCYRLREKGWKVYVLPDVKVQHAGSPQDRLRSGIFKEPLIQHTTYLFFKKHKGLIQVLILKIMQKTVSLLRFFYWVSVFFVSPRRKAKARLKCRIHLCCLKGQSDICSV